MSKIKGFLVCILSFIVWVNCCHADTIRFPTRQILLDDDSSVIRNPPMCNSNISNGAGDLLENGQIFRGKCEGGGKSPIIEKGDDDKNFLKFYTSESQKGEIKTRTELAITNSWYEYNKPIYISFRLRIPDNNDVTNEFFYLMQFWQPAGGPPLAGIRLTRGTSHTINFMTRNDRRGASMAKSQLSPGVWKYYVIKALISPIASNGEFSVWEQVDNSLGSYKGNIGYSELDLPEESKLRKLFRIKFGIYKGTEKNKDFEIHFDDIRISDSFEEVNPWSTG